MSILSLFNYRVTTKVIDTMWFIAIIINLCRWESDSKARGEGSSISLSI